MWCILLLKGKQNLLIYIYIYIDHLHITFIVKCLQILIHFFPEFTRISHLIFFF